MWTETATPKLKLLPDRKGWLWLQTEQSRKLLELGTHSLFLWQAGQQEGRLRQKQRCESVLRAGCVAAGYRCDGFAESDILDLHPTWASLGVAWGQQWLRSSTLTSVAWFLLHGVSGG